MKKNIKKEYIEIENRMISALPENLELRFTGDRTAYLKHKDQAFELVFMYSSYNDCCFMCGLLGPESQVRTDFGSIVQFVQDNYKYFNCW